MPEVAINSPITKEKLENQFSSLRFCSFHLRNVLSSDKLRQYCRAKPAKAPEERMAFAK